MTADPTPATTPFHRNRITNAIYPYTIRLLPVPTDRTFMYNHRGWPCPKNDYGWLNAFGELALGANQGRRALGKHFQIDAFSSYPVVRPLMLSVSMLASLSLFFFLPHSTTNSDTIFSVFENRTMPLSLQATALRKSQREGKTNGKTNASTRAHAPHGVALFSGLKSKYGTIRSPSCVSPAGMIPMHVQIPHDREGKRGRVV